MKTFVVVQRPEDWPLDVPGVDVVASRAYLTDEAYGSLPRARVYNLCRSYRYQSAGYYTSLLAAARGQRAIPSIATILDMKNASVVRVVAEDQDELIQRTLARIRSDRFVLSVYFGRNLAKRYDRLCRRLYELFPVPLLRATFTRAQRWRLQSVSPIPAREIPETHKPFVLEEARRYFARTRFMTSPRRPLRYDLAILVNDAEASPPSNRGAIRKFVRAAATVGMKAELIGKEDYGHLPEFDALFLRETTSVHHHTYRFARRAEAQGLAVIDDPQSILRCTNKVFLAELLARYGLPMPETRILHRQNEAQVLAELGLPCVLKKPDSAFSKGVRRADTEEEFLAIANEALDESDLVIVQRYVPTEFDWRVGVLDGRAIYVCKYHMAPKHWQIIQHTGPGSERYGRVETMAVDAAPPRVVRTAVKAARLIGNGLYGVDLKQAGKRFFVIEINDNPSIDSGYEDKVLGDELYRTILGSLVQRIEHIRAGNGVRRHA